MPKSVKSWIRIKVKIQELWRVKMEPLGAIDTQWRRGCSKWSRDDSVADSHHIDETLDPDPHQRENFDLDPDLYQ
jgi:hypothetical protein